MLDFTIPAYRTCFGPSFSTVLLVYYVAASVCCVGGHLGGFGIVFSQNGRLGRESVATPPNRRLSSLYPIESGRTIRILRLQGSRRSYDSTADQPHALHPTRQEYDTNHGRPALHF